MAGVRTQAFRAPAPTVARATMPRPAFARAPLRASRPAHLQSEFLSPVASLKGLCASFSQMVLSSARTMFSGIRLPLLIECNRKKGLGCTLGGTRRKRARVSGFRARMATVGGRKVVASRRKRGRKALCPGGMPTRK